jgi:hypothetical protein
MAKDIYHDTVKTALEKDGWTITDELLRLTIGSRSVYIDLGAEKLIAAEKEGRQIAIEIKSFLSPSPVNDLENARLSIHPLPRRSQTISTRTHSLFSHFR